MIKKKYLWNQYGLRLQFIKSCEGKAWNWLFLPGGPGLGSESLSQLTACLNLPGTLWHIDLPGDGSNTSENNTEAFKQWPAALADIVEAFDHVILVGHSTGGMYALSIPSLEHKLSGLVLIDSAPDASWQRAWANRMQAMPIEALDRLHQIYKDNPSHDTLKALTVAATPYLFTKQGQQKGRDLLQDLPYNYETYNWSEKYFDSTYQAQWFPQKLLTLIIAGNEDGLTPIQFFKDHAQFNRSNILIREISQAGHFPWIENPIEVAVAFEAFLHALSTGF